MFEVCFTRRCLPRVSSAYLSPPASRGQKLKPRPSQHQQHSPLKIVCPYNGGCNPIVFNPMSGDNNKKPKSYTRNVFYMSPEQQPKLTRDGTLPWKAVICIHPGMDEAVEGAHHGPHRVPHRHLTKKKKNASWAARSTSTTKPRERKEVGYWAPQQQDKKRDASRATAGAHDNRLTMLRAVRMAVEAWWVYWSHDTGLPLAASSAVSNHSQIFDLSVTAC